MRIKAITLVMMVLLCKLNFAQPPVGYYNSASGLSGYTLKTALKTIITNGHTAKSYNNLYTGYQTTDVDNFYDNDGSVLDMYSEIPDTIDAYFYTHNNRTCGNYSGENSCYNREHIMPQSVFNSASPMYSDIHFVVPSDGYVNGQRSNLPFGEVTNATWTSINGSKRGNNDFSAFYTSQVFEPIDEFKGDIARCLLYFATRYESNVTAWTYSGVFNGTSNQVYTDWFLNLLLSWHENDPVNAREISRNNGCYTYQGNRNPYIDSAQYVALIWGTSETTKPTIPLNLMVSNISTDSAILTWNSSFDSSGILNYSIFSSGIQVNSTSDTSMILYGLIPATTYSFYVKATDSVGNFSSPSNTVVFNTDTSYASITENVFESLKIYPNPTSNGFFNIVNAHNISNVSIVNLVGQTLKDIKFNQTSINIIDVTDIPTGVYFIKINSSGNEITMRIVINN